MYPVLKTFALQPFSSFSMEAASFPLTFQQQVPLSGNFDTTVSVPLSNLTTRVVLSYPAHI